MDGSDKHVSSNVHEHHGPIMDDAPTWFKEFATSHNAQMQVLIQQSAHVLKCIKDHSMQLEKHSKALETHRVELTGVGHCKPN
jgi:hypothetical protein